jgi:carbonic anhydrase
MSEQSAAVLADRSDTWRALLDDAARHASRRPRGVAEHRPRVAVLSCSDARVPPSVVFGRPAGELFVVRIAGNTASPAAVASLDYAVANLGVDTLVVLGHTGCGAVAAALDGTCEGSLAPVVAPLCELAAAAGCDDPTELSRLNVAATVHGLADASPAIADAIAHDRLTVHGAVYDLATGELIDVDHVDVESDPNPVSAPDPVPDPTSQVQPHRTPEETP